MTIEGFHQDKTSRSSRPQVTLIVHQSSAASGENLPFKLKEPINLPLMWKQKNNLLMVRKLFLSFFSVSARKYYIRYDIRLVVEAGALMKLLSRDLDESV